MGKYGWKTKRTDRGRVIPGEGLLKPMMMEGKKNCRGRPRLEYQRTEDVARAWKRKVNRIIENNWKMAANESRDLNRRRRRVPHAKKQKKILTRSSCPLTASSLARGSLLCAPPIIRSKFSCWVFRNKGTRNGPLLHATGS